MNAAKNGPDADADAHASADAWEALSLGELSREDEAVLRALAEENPALSDKLEAHAPLSSAFRESTVDRLSAQLEKERRARRLKTRMAVSWGALTLAAAAAALFALLPREELLPAYTLAIQGSLASVRGSEQAAPDVLRVSPRSELDLTLTPEAAVEGEVVLTVGLVSDHGVVLAKRAPERAASGAFRLVGSMHELFDAAPGAYRLAAAVARVPLSAEELGERVERGGPSLHTARLVYEAAPTP